ncbi:MAG: hypothetical protein ABIJ18_01070 [archaeon]
MEEELIKITPDKERVKSILEMVILRQKRIDMNKGEEFSTLLVEDYYEIIKELATATINLDGYKTLSHKILFDYLQENYKEFELSETEFMQDIRKTRNKVVYEGFFIKPIYLDRNKIIIELIIKKLKSLINKKLDN